MAALVFPTNPVAGQAFQNWVWDGTKWMPRLLANIPQCGQLQIVGSSPSNSLRFVPLNGDMIKINGIIYQIPSAGIQAAANNCYLNGVPGSSLVSSGFYGVYLFNNNGTLTIDFSPTLYVASTTPGNVGTMIKSGDDTRTLIGLAKVSNPASTAFYADQTNGQNVRSWFNRRTACLATVASSATGWASGVIANIYATALAGDVINVQSDWLISTTGATQTVNCNIELAGIGNFANNQVTVDVGRFYPMSISVTISLGDNWYTIQAVLGVPSYVLASAQLYHSATITSG